MKKIILVLGTLIVTFSGVLNSGQGDNYSVQRLIDVRVEGDVRTEAEIIIKTTGKVNFHIFKVTNPPRLVVEMVGTVYNDSSREIEVDNDVLKRIRVGQYKDDPVKIARVVLDMAAAEYFYSEKSDLNTITIDISLPGVTGEKKLESNENTITENAVTVSKPVKRRYNRVIEPNMPTTEHNNRIVKILRENDKREMEKSNRLKKISKLTKSAMPKEEDSVSMFGSKGKELMDFNFKDADIKEILKGFALKFNKNIVPASSVTGKVNLRLKSVPFEEAFRMLLDRKNLVAVQTSDNVIEIISKGSIPTQRSTFHLVSRTASEIQTTLNGLLTADESQGITIAIDEASNSLIVTASSDVLRKIELLVRQLDIKAPQIKIKARIIEVNASEGMTTGVAWANTMSMAGNVQEVRAVKDMSNYGLDTAYDIDTNETISNFATGGVLDISAVMNNITLYGVLNFLKSNSKAKTISEPTILTENNKLAKIHVGQNLPVVTIETTASGTTQSVTYIPEGVDLEVTPVVSPGSSLISLKLKVSVSEFTGWQANSPITSERSAETEVTVESGKSIIIGGLIKERVTLSDSGIPVLKDIPLIGYLFKNKSTAKDRTELLVFFSPEILAD